MQYQKAKTLYNDNNTFVSPVYTFPLAENIIVYQLNQGTIRENYFNHSIYKGQMPTLARDKHLSDHFFLHGPRLSYLSTEKVSVQSVRKEDQSGYSRAYTLNNDINKRSNRFPMKRN